MIMVDYQAHITHIQDVSADRKIAENLLQIVLEEIKYLEEELGVALVAWCSDASGESRAMRQHLFDLRPHLITLDCYSHQINLVVGDFFKHNKDAAHTADDASKVIKWFWNHSFVLGLLHKCQQDELGKILALILPVLTRWTAHYCSAAHLLDIAKPMVICVVQHEAELLDSSGTPKSEGQAAAQEVFDIVKDTKFWTSLLEMKVILQPLAIAANVTQAADTRLDHVLISFANLYHVFSHADIPEKACSAILNSLETCWFKSGQAPFIAAVYTNQFYQHHLFSSDEPALHPLGLYTMLKDLFAQMFPGQVLNTGDFFAANEAYAAGNSVFSDEQMCLQEIKEAMEDEEEDTEYKADTHEVIQGLMEDVDADEDIDPEADEDEEMVSREDGEQGPERAKQQRLPRVVFRWTKELTLAQMFNYSAAARNKGSWHKAGKLWAGGVSNVESEMKEYGLEDIFEVMDLDTEGRNMSSNAL
ncbi:hypothetical protein FRC06_006949 [Ceratobasidium sp. 370]|nr:hypothetical protein FRC06_006949 [Ceratobasidium sp. 370]